MNRKIAVLLTCHNRREKTIGCLRSLYRCSIPENHVLEVFLVDDGSTDGTSEAVKKDFPQVQLIQGNGQLYWNRGMHLAWETAAKAENFDFYLWLNDDVELFQNAITNLITASSGNESVVSGIMRSRNEETPTYGGRDFKGNLIAPNGKIQQCNVFNGNLILVPNQVYKRIGNLDPIFLHTMGDFDYSLRAKKNGIKCFVTTEYTGYCEKHASLSAWCLPEVPFLKRLRVLYTPLANSHPYYFFRFEKRHYGLVTAVKHYLSIHLRATIPQLWK